MINKNTADISKCKQSNKVSDDETISKKNSKENQFEQDAKMIDEDMKFWRHDSWKNH